MKKENWIWQPHAGHLIVGDKCQFILNTYVGGYIVSTIGDLWLDSTSRRIHAQVDRDMEKDEPKRNKITELLGMKGDKFDFEYRKMYGFEDLGAGRKYETMVFKAKRNTEPIVCCKWIQKSGSNVDFDGYNNPQEAREGHLAMCHKWSKKR